MTDHFRKKSIVFRDTRDHQKDDAKNRLPIPGPSPEKSVAEIDQLKKTDLSFISGSGSWSKCSEFENANAGTIMNNDGLISICLKLRKF